MSVNFTVVPKFVVRDNKHYHELQTFNSEHEAIKFMDSLDKAHEIGKQAGKLEGELSERRRMDDELKNRSS